MGSAKPPDEKNPETTIDETTPPGQQPEGEGQPAPSPPAAGAAPVREPKVLTIPSNAMTRIKAEERERGKKQAMKELDAQARAAGFKSFEEMQQAAISAKRGKAGSRAPATEPDEEEPETPAPPANGKGAPAHPRIMKGYEKKIAQLTEEKRRLNRAVSHEEKRRKQLERELEAREAESALRIEAIRAGVKDVDYAVELLRRSMVGKTAEQLRTFDEAKFFSDELRKSHPYLYEVEQRPAQTGPSGDQPPAPKPAPVAKETADNGSIDAKKLSREEYDKLLQSRGLLNPATATSSMG